MTVLLPKRVFFTKGVGVHMEKLASFELALRDAEIAKYNIVEVSSIMPPHCQIISKAKGLEMLQAGQIVHMVLSRNSSNEKGRLISASIGCAVPQDPSRHGYISEHHDFGQKEKDVSDYAEDLAAEMLASTLGIEFDADASYDEKRKVWQISDRIVRTRNTTGTAKVKENDRWTTVVSAAVFILE